MKKTILVVDDENDIVDLLSYNLAKENFEVIVARNGREALGKLRKKPDLVILDVMMPEMNGLEVVKEIRKNKETSSVPVNLLTAKGSETDEIVGLEVGADDYIVKPVRIGKIIARVNTILRRQEQISREAEVPVEILKYKDLEVNLSGYTVSIGNKTLMLPRKEFETLAYLFKNKGRVLSRESILNAVWGEEIHVVDRTIDVHIRKIREKLGRYSDIIETVSGIGYRFKAE